MALTSEEKLSLLDAFDALGDDRARQLLSWVKGGGSRLVKAVPNVCNSGGQAGRMCEDVFLSMKAAGRYLERTRRNPGMFKYETVELLTPPAA